MMSAFNMEHMNAEYLEGNTEFIQGLGPMSMQEKTSSVKFLNFWTPEIFAVIYLKFKQRGQSLGYYVKKMQME